MMTQKSEARPFSVPNFEKGGLQTMADVSF